MKNLIIAIIALMGMTARVNAQQPAVVVNDKAGWHKIAETTVDFKQERDEVAVLVSNRFAAVKFKVTEAPIELIDLDLTFDDGTSKNVKVGIAVKKAGDTSQVIDLPGSEHNVTKIAFRYRTMPNRKDTKAHVEIWGLKTNSNKDSKNNSWK